MLLLAGSAFLCQAAEHDPLTGTPAPSENARSFVASLSAHPTAALLAPTDEEVFGTYEGYNLDQYLTRDQGPIVFPIYVTRVYSKNRQEYGDIFAPWPQLVIWAFDVDTFCGNECDGLCEIDNVYLNGYYLGRLTGVDQTWTENRFDIPPTWFDEGKVVDALYNGPGVPPTPAQNWVAIDVDVQQVCGWKVQVDSGAIWARGTRPSLLIHGIKSDSSTWNTFRTLLPGDISEAFNVSPTASTFENSELIADSYIPEMLTSFGVERINLVGHSKGGLDASWAALRHPGAVENLVTIGSPLQGTDYADHLLAQHPYAYWFFNFFLGDLTVAGELSIATRDNYYTRRPTPPRGVQEWNIAGTEYRPTDTRCPVELLSGQSPFQVFSVDNDGYVPYTRAFAPWAGGPQTAFPDSHTSDASSLPSTPGPPNAELQDPILTEVAAGFLRPSGFGPAANSAAQAATTPPLQAASMPPTNVSADTPHTIVQDSTTSLQSGQTQTFNIPIDLLVTQARFHVGLSPQNALATVTLITPSGAHITMSQIPNLPAFSYAVSAPEAGNWKIKVQAVTLISTSEAFADLDSPVTLTASADKIDYTAAESISITAQVRDNGSGMAGMNLSGTAVSRWPKTRTLAFTDAGGGTYTTAFADHVSGGRWTTRIAATGSYCVIPISPSGGTVSSSGTQCSPFEREVTIPLVREAPTTATISSMSQGTATDTNGNGRYDNLTFAVSLDPVHFNGDYEIFARVAGTAMVQGSPQQVVLDTVDAVAHLNCSVPPVCTSGPQSIPLVFDGKAIHDSGIDGPYTLSELTLIGDKEDLTIEKRSGSLATSLNYHFYDFEGASLAFGDGAEHAEDLNSNGLFDTLIVDLQVTANPGYQGNYVLSASLKGLDGHAIAVFPATAQAIVVGTNAVRMTFSGQAIGSAGRNGPYRIADFSLQDVATPALRLATGSALVTRAYWACQFEGTEDVCPVAGPGGGGGPRGNPLPGREQ
ncbi:MAG: alpha/beta hydrolase [Acidobacteria bacterium]|nr:alpha/beta hydrolase [Acidobacteriota bacterium]